MKLLSAAAGPLSALATLIIALYCLLAMVMAIVIGCNGNPLDALNDNGPVATNLVPKQEWSGLRVISAGLERTGTESLHEAMHMMGIEPTYSFVTLDSATASEHAALWLDAAADPPRADWRRIFGQYAGVVDAAAALVYADLLRAYPAAKVVLTVRRNASDWRRSWQRHNCRSHGAWAVQVMAALSPEYGAAQQAHERILESLWHRLDPKTTPQTFCEDGEAMEAVYEAWNKAVAAAVPAGRLLVFQTGRDGYRQLADFLGVEAPTEPYPYVNTLRRAKAQLEAACTLGCILAAAACLLGPPYLLLARRRRPPPAARREPPP